MQDFLLIPEAANDLLTAFPEEMFENIADLERGIRFDPQNFWLDASGANAQVSLDALMAGLLGGEASADDVMVSGASGSKSDKEKSGLAEIPDELPPLEVVGFRDSWEWLCMSGSIVTMPLTPFMGYDVAVLLANLNEYLSNFDINDVDGDGTPNDSDIAPFDGTNNGILVTGSTRITALGGGLSSRAWGDGVFELFRNGQSLGNFRVTSVTSATGLSATTGSARSLGVEGVIPVASSDDSFSYTNEAGTTFTYTPYSGT